MLDAILDELITIGEQSGDQKMLDSFNEWFLGLRIPPDIGLDDVDILEDAVWAAFTDRWRVITDLHTAGVELEADDAPEGWDNASLLAQMQAAAAGG